MSMMEATEPAEEPKAVALATATLTINEPYQGGASIQRSREIAAFLTAELSLLSPRYQFSIEGQDVEVFDIQFDVEQVQSGSIIATLKVVGGVVLGGYYVVANYPNFKIGFEQMSKDIRAAAFRVSEKLGGDRLSNLSVVARDEKGILSDIQSYR